MKRYRVTMELEFTPEEVDQYIGEWTVEDYIFGLFQNELNSGAENIVVEGIG